MIEAEKRLKKEGLIDKAHIILQIHDELVYEIEAGAIKKASKIIQESMEQIIKKDVPFVATVKAGYNWDETEDI